MTCPQCGRPNPETSGQCAACDATLFQEIPTLTGVGGRPASTAAGSDRTMTASGSAPAATGGYGFAGPARLAPQTLLGTRYEILEILGEGGMGTVYKAQDRELGRLVALKVIRPEMASRPEILERFKREILLASQVTHKNVLRIHDLGEAGDIRFISMLYVEGVNLKGFLEQEGPLSLDKGLPLARQIGEALQAAHDAGIVHRDLKPQNILIDRDGNAYIADFGISRSLAEGGTMTETGAILGTVDYMSPEQARGETPDHRGDIYSFGVILYEMFTGGLPFRASNALSVMMKRLHEDAPSMRQARPGLPAWLAAIVARAMKRAPEERYQSSGDLLRDLERQRASRSWRRFARPRYLVPATALLLMVAAAGMIPRFMRPESPTLSRPQVSLVILPFQNATGDSRYDWARSGLPSLLRSELLQSEGLRLVGEARLLDILETLQIAAGEETRPATLRRITSLLGADSVLGGRLVKIGDRLRIEAGIYRSVLPPATAPGPGDSQPTAATALPSSSGDTAFSGTMLQVDGVNDDAVFSMVDDLTRRVQNELGLSHRLFERQRSATELTTASVDALRLYSEGLALARSGQQIEAARRLEAALEKDPQFSVARALLAETYDRLGYSDKAVAEANKAVAGLGRTSPYEATRIRAAQARLTNNLDVAEQAYRALTKVAPHDAEAFFNLGSVQEERGELLLALESFRRATALDPKHPSAHFAVGRAQVKLGNPSVAMQEFTMALNLHTESGNEEGRATVLNGLGNASLLLGRYDEALKNYQESLEIRRRLGERRGVFRALDNIAIVLRRQGKYDDAIRSRQEALSVAQELGDRNGLAVCYSNLGDLHQAMGRPEEALRAYEESLKIEREIDDKANLARSLANVGYINSVLGQYVQAYFFLKEALAKQRDIGDKSEIVRSLIDLGLLEQVQGRYEEALKYDTEAMTLAKETEDTEQEHVLSANLSTLHEEQGEYARALSLLRDMEKVTRGTNNTTMLTTCLVNLGGVLRRLGDTVSAEKALGEATSLARATKDTPLLTEALIRQADLLLARDDRTGAVQVARDAVALARRSQDVRLQLLARLQAGAASRSPRDLEAVAQEAQTAGLLPVAAGARLALARVHLAAGRMPDAARTAARAQTIATPMHLRDLLFQACHVAGKALKTQGQTAAAQDRFRDALGFLEEMRLGLSDADLDLFLARPETTEFARDASSMFQGANLHQEADRLKALLRP